MIPFVKLPDNQYFLCGAARLYRGQVGVRGKTLREFEECKYRMHPELKEKFPPVNRWFSVSQLVVRHESQAPRQDYNEDCALALEGNEGVLHSKTAFK